MVQPHKPQWFHRLGPLNWYRDEWVRFEFEILGREFGMIWLRYARRFVWLFGARVVARTDFGLPGKVEGGLRFDITR